MIKQVPENPAKTGITILSGLLSLPRHSNVLHNCEYNGGKDGGNWRQGLV